MSAQPVIFEPGELNADPAMFWNWAACEMNRITHSVNGPHAGPTMSSRALGMIQLAIHDAWFSMRRDQYGTFLHEADPAQPDDPARHTHLPPMPPGANQPSEAIAGAALQCLTALYAPPDIDELVSPAAAAALTAGVARIRRLYVKGHTPAPVTKPTTAAERDRDLNKVQALDPGAEIIAGKDDGASFEYGEQVAVRILQRLAVREREPGASDFNPLDNTVYTPDPLGRFQFEDEPSNPIKRNPTNPLKEACECMPTTASRVYHGPFYGSTAVRFSVTGNHVLADPPRDTMPAEAAEYLAALKEVYHRGGAPSLNSTTRTPDQTVSALYWAYDGANLIGTPPRLYNQVLRRIAFLKRHRSGVDFALKNTDDYVRLLALANVAMADAGTLAWAEKYHHAFWRPLSGVREHGKATGSSSSAPYEAESINGAEHLDDLADPFWLALGAPSTNTDGEPFKPPFPAYPSGHATFGAAAFQMARLFYKARDKLTFSAGEEPGEEEPDGIGFDLVSDELNGISRDLYQKYNPKYPIQGQEGLLRTRVVRRFDSLWAAIYDNAASRVYLGVHWRFDSFAGADVVGKLLGKDGLPLHKSPEEIRYVTNGPRQGNGTPVGIGGVPLGITIANDIFKNELQQSPDNIQPAAIEMSEPASAQGPRKSKAAVGAAMPSLRIEASNIRPSS